MGRYTQPCFRWDKAGMDSVLCLYVSCLPMGCLVIDGGKPFNIEMFWIIRWTLVGAIRKVTGPK